MDGDPADHGLRAWALGRGRRADGRGGPPIDKSWLPVPGTGDLRSPRSGPQILSPAFCLIASIHIRYCQWVAQPDTSTSRGHSVSSFRWRPHLIATAESQ